MSRARLASVGLPLRTVRVLPSNESFEAFLVDSLVNIATVATSHLQDGLSIPVDNLIPPDTILRPPQVCTIAG
jgi:hypothetical protein